MSPLTSRPTRSFPRTARRGWQPSGRSLAARSAAALLLAACDLRSGQARPSPAELSDFARTIPAAEFLVAGTDSSFWIRTGPDAGPDGLEVRRAPILLTRHDGRWRELYVTEEDHSFYDAVFVAQSLWWRDPVSQDSAAFFVDDVVPRLAAEYARAHPGQLPLEPDEPEADEPSIVATGELALLDLVGGYVSVEHFTDLHLPRLGERHELRRRVVELGSGREVGLPQLLGEVAAADVTRQGRAAFAAARDSARGVARQLGVPGVDDALARFSFDAGSFTLTQLGESPGVVFYAVGRGEAAEGFALPIAPIALPGGAWWDSSRAERPLSVAAAGAPASEDVRRWRRSGLTVAARPDPMPGAPAAGTEEAEVAPDMLTLGDSTGREWAIGRIGSPARRLYWLGADDVTAEERRALARAFYDAAFYDGTVRATSAPPGPAARGDVRPRAARADVTRRSPSAPVPIRTTSSGPRLAAGRPMPRASHTPPSR